MRILVIGDHESKSLWDFYEPSKLEDIDLIISCGDLSPRYLSFLVTMAHAPVLYIHGNHDDKYEMTPPEGCICVDDDLYVYNGIRILGLGGSHRYRDGKYMYTEAEMRRRIRRLRSQLRRHNGFDILLTHAPAQILSPWPCTPELWDPYSPENHLRGYHHHQQL